MHINIKISKNTEQIEQIVFNYINTNIDYLYNELNVTETI